MALNPQTTTHLAELRRLLEQIAGKPLNVSDQQLLWLNFPVALEDTFSTGTIVWRRFLTGTWCQSPATYLDIGSSIFTDAGGTAVFLLSSTRCVTNTLFAEPVNLLATPYSTTPCFVTFTYDLVQQDEPAVQAACRIPITMADRRI